jgi:hypothetical protein
MEANKVAATTEADIKAQKIYKLLNRLEDLKEKKIIDWLTYCDNAINASKSQIHVQFKIFLEEDDNENRNG